MAALVLARMPPVTVQAAVRKRAAGLKNEGVILSADLKEEDMMSRWQALWGGSKKAEWTKFLIPNVRRWWTQGPKEVSYHMAQALTGHGCFQAYLWRKNIVTNPGCVHCPEVFDDAEHTVFNCPFWDAARADVAAAIRKSVGPEDVQYLMCGPVLQELPEEPSTRRTLMAASVRHKELFKRMVETILAGKEELERQWQCQV